MDTVERSYRLPGGAFVEGAVLVDGVSISYAQAGAGPDIVMLPTSSGMMYNIGADKLAESFRVTMIDPPGWGESPLDQKTKPIPELAHTTAATIQALGIDRFVLTGGSIGGIHALWLTAHYPERVRATVLDGSMAFRKDNWATPGADPVKLVQAAEQGADVSFMLPRAHPSKPWATLDFRQRQLKRILRVIAVTGPEFDEDLADRLRPLETPVLALFGVNDHFVFPSVAKVYEGLLKHCKTMIIDDAGHEIPNEQPDLYAALVKGFVESLQVA